MLRWIAVSALASLLAGCVSYPSYRSYDDGYYTSGRDAYGDPVYVDGSSYYAPAYADRGDYYYGSVSYSYGYSNYVDYPYYYSLFWPINRWAVDPYWHPGFYYGVTYYPRSYFSVGFGARYGYGHGGYYGSFYRPWGYGGFAYSPYRLSWVDHYYDWSPWYSRHPHRSVSYYAPRYGNARHEADWLSRQTRQGGYAGRGDGRSWRDREGLPNTRAQRYEDRSRTATMDRREALRGADYDGRSRGRADPGVSGFGYRREAEIKRPSELRSPRGVERGERSVDSRGQVERYRPPSEGRGEQRGRYIGDSGDVRRDAASQVDRREARSYVAPSREPRSEAIERGSPRSTAPAARSRAADPGFRIDARPTQADTYRTQPRYAPAPNREAPVYREPAVRQSPPRTDYDTRYRSADSVRAPAPVREAPQYRGGESRSAPAYRAPAPSRDAIRVESAPRQPVYAPREAPATRQPAYREPAPSYSAPAPAPARAEPSRSESRAEGRRRGRDDDR